MLASPLTSALFWSGVAICAVAQVFIMRAVFRTLPAAPTKSAVPAPRRWVEIVQVLLPILGLAAVFYGAWQSLSLPTG
jgi:hypothetical protein